MRWPEKWPFFFIIQLNRAEVWVFFFFPIFSLNILNFYWYGWNSLQRKIDTNKHICVTLPGTTIIYHTDTPIWCSLVIGTAAADVHRRLPVLFSSNHSIPLCVLCVSVRIDVKLHPPTAPSPRKTDFSIFFKIRM